MAENGQEKVVIDMTEPFVFLAVGPGGEAKMNTNIGDPAQINFLLDKAKVFVLNHKTQSPILKPTAVLVPSFTKCSV